MIKITNHRLEIARKEQCNKKKMVKKQKTKIIVAICHKNKVKISLSNRRKKNYKNNTKNNTNLNQTDNKYLLQL